jgi:hypothetical protein
MEQIASDGRRAFFLRVLAPGEEPGSTFGGEPYPVLLWAARPTKASQKQRLCAALIASGCRYVVCGGRESVAWEEAADEAFTAQDLTDEELRERMVMTSSLVGYPPHEAAFDLIHTTSFGEHDFTRYLVLLIGEDPKIREQLIAAIREEVTASS